MLDAPLDATKTGGFTLGPPLGEARVAVVLLHGFTGSPWEVRPVAEALAARGVHVVCPRLPGHGTVPEALLFEGHHEWLRAAGQALDSVTGARRVVLCGLSMGALLSMVLTARARTRIDGLVLMAPVLKFKSRAQEVFGLIAETPVAGLLDRWVPKDGTDIENDEVRAQSPVLSRFPLVAGAELVKLQALAREAEPRIRCPSLILGAVHDHVVDTRAVEALSKRLPYSKFVLLQRGFHIIPRDSDRAIALSEIAHFVDTIAG